MCQINPKDKRKYFDAWVANLTSTYNIKIVSPKEYKKICPFCVPNQMKFCYDIPKNI